MKKLYTINTVNNFMDLIFKPFGMPFAKDNPEIEVYNIMDDSLLKETLANGRPTVQVCNRIMNYAQTAQNAGASGILVTCTSVNQATKLISQMISIPMLNIEEPVAQLAVDNGRKIGILGTIPTSPAAIGRVIEEKAKEAGKTIEIVNSVADGAFDVLCSGDRAKHDEMVCEALYKLSKKVDVVVLAQISMSLLIHDPIEVPIFKIGRSGFDKIKQMML